MSLHRNGLVFVALSGFLAAPLLAQEVTGTLGQPTATLTLKGSELPAPPLPFGGVIKEKATESTPWWPPRIVPPKKGAEHPADHD